MNNTIIIRTTDTVYNAMMTAQAMENVGISVINVSPCYPKSEKLRFMVVGRYDEEQVSTDKLDKEITSLLFPTK